MPPCYGLLWALEPRRGAPAGARPARRGLGCDGEYVEKEEEIGPAIARAYVSDTVDQGHVCIDPTANSEKMPKYDRFRTWYAEGTQ
ncbi:hypothetical protein NGTWS0302_16360 [Mycolicibacterium cyprinidarum]|uniref:Uncharacterized protein n=1 Tax=Mycolicibacterium cyprinidarum TaxID=2860311 RepID=A0ABQ4VCG2_9MYCO|nr:hypothetical protein NGTWS1702_21980 [Mycolicibacterium sp. NGTWSNA01]GJF18331.1 hypothetical protein NGTWS0302_16360 [Mycolicibacterium sp. NGTWS0302]